MTTQQSHETKAKFYLASFLSILAIIVVVRHRHVITSIIIHTLLIFSPACRLQY